MSNKKQREVILNEELSQTNTYLQVSNNELLDIQDEIQQIENTLSSIYISRDRYIERLKNRYKYEEINNEFKEEIQEDIEENNLFLNSVENNSDNKNFFQNMLDESNDDFENEEFDNSSIQFF